MENVGLLTVDLELLDVYQKIYSDVFLIWTAEQITECSPAADVFCIECKCSSVMHLSELCKQAYISSLALRGCRGIFRSAEFV